jgi:hypothetical protein
LKREFKFSWRDLLQGLASQELTALAVGNTCTTDLGCGCGDIVAQNFSQNQENCHLNAQV